MLISIIIPCKNKNDNIDLLLKDIANQEIIFDKEIIRVDQVSPSGKARNVGANRAKGEILVFLDNDISFGNKIVLQNVLQPLLSDKKIGVCGVSQRIPLDSNWLQRRCAKEVLHTEHAVVEEITDVGMVGGCCLAVKNEAFLSVEKFNDKLHRGVDVEFCHRIKENGYRIILVPQTWIYHPPPKTLSQFAKLHFRNGKATAFVDRNHSELNFDIGTSLVIDKLDKKNKISRIKRYIGSVIKSIIYLKPLNLIGRISYMFGYFWERLLPSKNDVS